MDLSDLTLLPGTLPKSNNMAVPASLLVLVETSRTMTGLVGSERFSLPYGGELLGAAYSGVLALLASIVVRSPLPLFTGAAAIIFCVGIYHWQEEKAA